MVEGFYGAPWSQEARIRQLDFYGRNKMNVYIYGPKDDPYHRTPNWRKPYPAREGEELKVLVNRAKENNVIFYWAIHPGQDIRWNEEDRSLLLQKFESMYQLGVRGFAVFFDDISGEGTKADKQAELLNYIDDHFVKVKRDVAPLILCPTEYNKSWTDVEGGYLTTLGDKLNEGIKVMWTGDMVVATIDKSTLDFVNPLLKRKAYIWWNFPVSDYVQDHLLLGPVYGNGLDIKDDMSAFVSNPMEHAEASKISLYSVADYTWNMENYDSETSWKHAEKNEIDEDAYRQVAEECRKIIVAADGLLASGNENRPLITEIRPWLIQFKQVGEYGAEVLNMIRLRQQKDAFIGSYEHARALLVLMGETDAQYKAGIKSGSLHLMPTFNALFEAATTGYNAAFHAGLDTKAVYSPYTLKSDVNQLASLPIQQKGKVNTIIPSNEVINWQAGGVLTISMDYARQLSSVLIDLGDAEVADSKFKLEVTSDGTNWQAVDLKPGYRTQVKASLKDLSVAKMRLVNVSDTEQKVYFKMFRFTEN